MTKKVHQIDTISEIHKMYGLDKPKHPLISVIDQKSYVTNKEWIGQKIYNRFYNIYLKDGSCGLEYGRNTYDFSEGVLNFMSPNQVFSVTDIHKRPIDRLMVCFHPKLIENTSLAEKIDRYNFFSYAVHEALHLSEQEEKTIRNCIAIINDEISQRIDRHSNSVIISGLELLLNMCNRFYERQFNTRNSESKDVLSKVEMLLKEYYTTEKASENGLPSVSFLANEVNLSPGYLSDLLKNETGKTTKEHIHLHLIKHAKLLLINSKLSMSEIAYTLGFEYPQHFSKLFKTKTGMNPKAYRTTH